MDWHARELLRACRAAGADITAFRLSEAVFDTTTPFGLSLPGLTGRLPDMVLVRAVSGGSFEEVTRRLGVLHALRELGVPVWNDARVIERCVDKSTTTFLFARAGLRTPATWTVEGREPALEVVRRETHIGPLVLKPLFGAQGRGLRLIAGEADLPEAEAVAGVYYLQRYVPTGTDVFQDHRLFVCDGDIVASMTRQADNWITNVRRGGRPRPLAPDSDLAELAVRAAACVGTCYAGVDVLRDRDGVAWVLEVNSMPGWKGLQQVTGHSIADRIAASIVRSLR